MDSQSQHYSIIYMTHTINPTQQFRNGGQYGLTTFVNFSFHGHSSDPTPFHPAWDQVYDPNSL